MKITFFTLIFLSIFTSCASREPASTTAASEEQLERANDLRPMMEIRN